MAETLVGERERRIPSLEAICWEAPVLMTHPSDGCMESWFIATTKPEGSHCGVEGADSCDGAKAVCACC
jgi:hypothetical protein